MKNEIRQYKQCWVMYRDAVLLDDVANLDGLDETRLIEARFTDGSKELHIWRDNDGKLVECGTEIPTEDIVTNEYRLLEHFGKSIRLVDIMDYDCDGQAFVKATAFAGFE